MCIHSLHFTAAWAGGESDRLTTHCGTERSCSCVEEERMRVIYFEWMLFFSFFFFIFRLGKERRRIPLGGGRFGRDHSKPTSYVYLQKIDFLCSVF